MAVATGGHGTLKRKEMADLVRAGRGPGGKGMVAASARRGSPGRKLAAEQVPGRGL